MSELLATKPELCCLNTILSLENNPAAPVNIKKQTNTLDRLISDDFLNAWELTEDPSVPAKNPPSLPSGNAGDNKVRRYYKYEKPFCDESVESVSDDICTVTGLTNDPTGYIAVDINKSASKSWVVSIAEFNELCEAPSVRRADKIRRAAYALKVDANKKIITALYGLINDYANGDNGLTAVRSLNILTNEAKLNPVEMSKVAQEYRDSLYNDDYVMIGGNELAKWYDVMMWQLSPEGRVGIDPINFPFIYDQAFDGIFQGLAADTDSHAVTIPIGGVFVDIWNEFTGYKELSDPNYVFTTIEIDGILYDYSMKFDECDKNWKEMLTLHFGIGGIPAAAYCSGNGLIRHWELGCAAATCV